MRAAVYTRVSSTRQEEDGTSLETQRDRCVEWAVERGYTVADDAVYADVYSGSNLYDRPALTALRSRLRKREFDAVVIYALDRLSRKQSHVAILAEEAERHGVALLFVLDDFGDGAVGEFVRNAKAFAAELEKERLVERTQRGQKARVTERGRPSVGPRPPYGYRWVGERKERLEQNPDTAPVMRWIFEQTLAGQSAYALADSLNGRGVPVASGRAGVVWRPTTITKLMKNSVYFGEFRAFVRARENQVKGKTGFHEDQGILVPNVVIDPIVSEEEFRRANAVSLSKKYTATKNSPLALEALLRAGIVRCGYCGNAMHVQPKKTQLASGEVKVSAHYQCQMMNRYVHGCPATSIAASVIDDVVWRHVVGVLDDPDEIRERVSASLSEETPMTLDLDIVTRRLGEIGREERQLQAVLGRLTNDAVLTATVEKINALGEQRRNLEQQREEIASRHEQARRRKNELDGVLDFCEKVGQTLRGDLDYDTKRLALHALGVRVYVWRTDHDPRFLIEWSLPSDEEETYVASDRDLASVETPSTSGGILNMRLRWTDRDVLAA